MEFIGIAKIVRALKDGDVLHCFRKILQQAALHSKLVR